MEQETFLVVKGSLQLLSSPLCWIQCDTRDRSRHSCALHHGPPGSLCLSPAPPHPRAWHLWEPDAPQALAEQMTGAHNPGAETNPDRSKQQIRRQWSTGTNRAAGPGDVGGRTVKRYSYEAQASPGTFEGPGPTAAETSISSLASWQTGPQRFRKRPRQLVLFYSVLIIRRRFQS